MVEFDLSEIIGGPYHIVNATLEVYQSVAGSVPSTSYAVHRITSSWIESTVTWNSRPSWATQVEATFTSSSGSQWWNFDITNLVQTWVNGTDNHGLIVYKSSGCNTPPTVFSSDHTTDSLRPKLTIEYVDGRPDGPTLVSPADGATDVPIRPTFTWNSVASVGLESNAPASLGYAPLIPADHYHLQVAADAGFSDVVIDQNNIHNTSYTPFVDLDYGSVYYWRVRGVNSYGSGEWSAEWSFTTVGGANVVEATWGTIKTLD